MSSIKFFEGINIMANYYTINTGLVSGEITLNETLNGTSGNDVLAATSQITKNVSVATVDGGNKYQIGNVDRPFLTLDIGRTYVFDQSDPSNTGHPIRFSTSFDGTWGGGEEFTTGVSSFGVPGSEGAYTQITVPADVPTLNYYCLNHSGMGQGANLGLNLQTDQIYIGQSGVDSGSLIRGDDGNDTINGGPGADVIFGGKGNDTLSGGEDGSQSSNTFVFNPGDGQDVITDFSDGFDSVVYEGFSDTELYSIKESSTENGDRKILFEDGSSITMLGIFGIKTEHLVEGERFIKWMKSTKEPGTFKFFVDPGGNTHFDTHTKSNYISEVPTESQYSWMRQVIETIQEEVGVKFEEVFSAPEADIPFIVTSVEFGESSLSSAGGGGQNNKTFGQTNPKLNISNSSGSDWNQIFTHELGHLMGLEHPWDQKNGDIDIPTLNGEKIGQQSVSTDRTVTSYKTFPDATTNDYFRALDIKALQEIWGDPNAPFILSGTRVDKGTLGPAVYLQGDGSHDILSSSDATVFIDLTDVKGKAWSGNPIGVNETATGYELILETVGKKGTSYSEISVSSDGVVAKRLKN